MAIITHNRKDLLISIVKKMKSNQIKNIIKRQRLKFNKSEICFYIDIIFKHVETQKTFKSLFKKEKLKIKYSCFMSNITLFSNLFRYLFYSINSLLKISPSKLLNIVDTTLIPEKKPDFITKDDWTKSRVTSRIKDGKKNYICGSKALVFINRAKKIYYVERLGINSSDQNILKSTAYYKYCLKGILLADRGFSNNNVRTRIIPYCMFISPYHYKSKLKLTKKERKLYKRRWRIENVFKDVKINYSEIKLNLTGKYTNVIKDAKLYATFILFNLQ